MRRVVVGSGPIGAVAARRFAEAEEQVTLLEAGQPVSSPPGSHVRKEIRVQQDPDSYFAGSMVISGISMRRHPR